MNVYITCMILGLAFPIISLAFNIFDFAFDAVAIDALDLDVGDFDICFLPLSFNAICLAAVVYGGVGIILINRPPLFRNLIAGLLAYVAAVLIQSLIKYLKRHSMDADEISNLIGKECIVSNRIPKDGFGSIVFKEEGRADISMPAKAVDETEYCQDMKVTIEYIKDHVAFVKSTT